MSGALIIDEEESFALELMLIGSSVVKKPQECMVVYTTVNFTLARTLVVRF